MRYFLDDLTSVAEAVRVKIPSVRVTVKGYVPRVVPELTVTVSAELSPAGLGLKLPLAPLGRPLTDKLTSEVNPPVLVILTV